MVTKLYSRILQKQSCRILIIKPSSLGDILHLFPALELLKRFNPTIVADFVINPEFSPLLDYSPLKINKRIFFERKKLGKINSFIPELYKLVKNYYLSADSVSVISSVLLSDLLLFKYTTITTTAAAMQSRLVTRCIFSYILIR